MAIKRNENFITFSNSMTFRKPRGTDLVIDSELIPGFYRSKSNVLTPGSLRTIKSPTGDSLRHQIPSLCPHSPPHGIYIDRCISPSERAFEKYIPWGLFSEFYGIGVETGNRLITNHNVFPCFVNDLIFFCLCLGVTCTKLLLREHFCGPKFYVS